MWNYDRLIKNASSCMDRAENIKFKQFWQKVLVQLLKKSKKLN
jgi:hypothetical protein